MEIGGNMNMDVDMNMLGHDHHQHHHHGHHNINTNSSNIGSRGQNGNNTTHLASWDIWHTTTAASNNNTTTDNSGNLFYSAAAVTVAASRSEGDASSHPLLLGYPLQQQQQQQQEQQQLSNNFYSGGGSHYQPDPHLMCLKLGKRHYFEDHAHVPPGLLDERHVGGFPVGMMMTKRGKAATAAQLYGAGGMGGPALALKVVPRCQVEGCHVALVNAKEYHRRHKVCEMHSKASKVTVLGQDQRFCQQCSRFHLVSEFDESKRSCRRRLAGHNQRRRKSSHDSQGTEHKVMVGGKFQYLSSSTGRALSLLSSKTSYDSWVSPSDLSSRSSAALRELIAENRAAVLARKLLISSPSISDRNCWVDTSSASHNNDVHAITEDLFGDHGQSWSNSVDESNHHHHQMFSDQNHDHHGWDRFHETRGADLTLDLRQATSQVYGFLPQRAKSKAEEDQECDMWNSFQGD